MTLRPYRFAILFWALGSASLAGASGIEFQNEIVRDGYLSLGLVSVNSIENLVIAPETQEAKIKSFCQSLTDKFHQLGWNETACSEAPWKTQLQTSGGHPLIFAEFGSGPQSTLVLGGVHADELPTIPLAFRFASYLQKHPEIYKDKNIKIVIAPLVNPDGFLRDKPTRTNGNGVDLNRNFFTLDWYDLARKRWLETYNANPRSFPGYFPNSEIETLFQISLLEAYNPAKVMSLHSPLTFLDYDGPGDQKRTLTATERKAKQLVHEISKHARNYKVVDYHFYPGSLGNFAGNERRIPTVTLELNTSDPKKVDPLWRQFLPGLVEGINYKFSPDNPNDPNSLFFRQYHPVLAKLLGS